MPHPQAASCSTDGGADIHDPKIAFAGLEFGRAGGVTGEDAWKLVVQVTGEDKFRAVVKA
jgi:hypothetical protein